jgi:5'-methylthioadenosine phosphorylase
MKTGLIVGTGMGHLAADEEWREISTPYGSASTANTVLGANEVVLLRRHGPGLNVPPHLINYRANMWALRESGVKCVLSTAAVGSLSKDLKPGDLAVIQDFIDFTKRRESTIYDKPGETVVHIDFSEPYCPALSSAMENVAEELGIGLARRVVYVCVDGPRYETPAEIRMFAQWGGDVIGMTGVPEVVIARELGMCYASLAIVTNYGAGISERALSHQEVVDMVARRCKDVYAIIENTLSSLPETDGCCSRG